MKDYINKQGHKYKPESEHFGWTSIKVLPFLTGRPWDVVALAFVHALRPSYIRVIEGAETLDAMTWRITVRLNNNKTIREIEQEVEVWLPDGVVHSHALEHALRFGIDSEQCKWHQDETGTMFCGITGRYYKFTKDGKTVEFPMPKTAPAKAEQATNTQQPEGRLAEPEQNKSSGLVPLDPNSGKPELRPS